MTAGDLVRHEVGGDLQARATFPRRFGNAIGIREQKDGDLVQLDCASCHQMTGASKQRVRGDGRIMTPIKFDHDCKACHDLETVAVGADNVRLCDSIRRTAVQPRYAGAMAERTS